MKKILLTAALGCTMITGAFADGGPVSHNGNVNVQVADYITMVPNGPFGAVTTYDFNDPTSQTTYQYTNPAQFTIGASRSWHVTYSATPFVRQGSNSNPNISNSVQPENVLAILSNNPIPASVYVSGGYNPAHTTPDLVAAQAIGTISSNFTLTGRYAPGLSNQMSGTYQTTIAIIASLD